MQHMGHKHGGQPLLEDSVGQLRWLNRQGALWHNQIAALSPVQLLPYSTLLSANFALGTPSRTDTAQASGRSGRRYGTRSATPSGLASTSREPLYDSPLPNCRIRDVVLTEREYPFL